MVLTFLYIICHVLIFAYSKQEDYGPKYGEDWLYFVDENGTLQVMEFSSPERLCFKPQCFKCDEVSFHLYTRKNPTDPELLKVPDDDQPMNSSYFNPSNKLRVITHGWLSSDTKSWLQNIKDSLLRKYNLNVITVDWSKTASKLLYAWPAQCTRDVGEKLAKLLSSMEKTFHIKFCSVHLIGHSLGAHIMGFAGMFLKGKIGRITGLDPARPLFEIPLKGNDYILEKSDARFVDIIHTCAGVYGYRFSHGHADFYPNSGWPIQPGCEGVVHMIEGCSHRRSYLYFGDSIESSNEFLSYPCESWAKFNNGQCKTNPTLMGYHANVSRMGDFYLRTKKNSIR